MSLEEAIVRKLLRELAAQTVQAPTEPPSPVPVVEELGEGQYWTGRLNILGILAEEESEIQINGSRLYPMKPDEGLIITGITITSVYVKKGKVKLIGFYLPRTALPRMIQQRSVTLYGVENAMLTALDTFYKPKEGSVDYTTTDTLTDVVAIDASSFNEITIMIKNTGTANSADVEIYTKANTNGQIEYLEYSGTLAPGDVIKTILNGRYARIIVKAKSTVAGSPTTIRIEWIGGK